MPITTFRIGNIVSDGIRAKKVSNGFLQIWHSEMSIDAVDGDEISPAPAKKTYPDLNVCTTPPIPNGREVIIRTEKDWQNFLKRVV